MFKSRVVSIAASFVAAMSFMSMAHASFVMYLDDTSTTGIDVILSDEQAIGFLTSIGATTNTDAYAGAGTMTYLGAVGTFNVNVTTGVSKPVLGGGVMDFNSVNVSGGAGGNLLIGLTDTGFSGAYPGYSANYGGTTSGTVDFNFLHDSSNGEFGGTSVFNPAVDVGPAYSASASSSVAAGSPYSLTILASITHGAGTQNTSFDAELRPVPVPATVWLFGSGLLGLVSIARRKKAA